MDESEQNVLKNEFNTTNRKMYVVSHKGDVPDYQHRATFNDDIKKILADPKGIQARATQGDNDVPE